MEILLISPKAHSFFMLNSQTKEYLKLSFNDIAFSIKAKTKESNRRRDMNKKELIGKFD